MQNLKVTRAHLKSAVDNQQWDLLDKLLEIDTSQINDNSLYTDTWGEWWGLLVECIRSEYIEGVKIVLKYKIKKKRGNWGDCIVYTPLEEAKMKKNQEIINLLKSKEKPTYIRKTDPKLPPLIKKDTIINQQGEIRDTTGLIFPYEGLSDSNNQDS